MAITVKCIRSDGDREASSISDSLIVTENMAKQRGKRFLDDPSQGGYYLVKKRTLKVPHKGAGVVPGTWITVSDSHLGLRNQRLKVKSYTINITRKSVWATIETEQYETFQMP